MFTDSQTHSGNDSGTSFQRMQTTRQSIFGRIRKCENITFIEWIFILLSSINLALGLGFSLYRLISIPFGQDAWTFSFLVTFNLLFAIYYLFHGVFQEQVFEVVMLIFTTGFIWALLTVNFTAYSATKDDLKLIRFILSSVISFPNIILAAFVAHKYRDSGNLVFRTVGGDMRLQKMCRELFLEQSLLIFDAQSFSSCLILFTKGDGQNLAYLMTEDNVLVFIGGCLYVSVWVIIGYVALRTENLDLTWLFALISLLQPIYVLFLFVQVFWIIKGPYNFLTISTMVSGVSFLICHFALMSLLPVVAFNFGKGLREKIYGIPPEPPIASLSASAQPLLRDTNTENQRNYDTITSNSDP